jgi:hypothetical protein
MDKEVSMGGPGIDWGRGQSNIDHTTGIRYGVISQNEVLQAWCESSEPYYGEPCCPKCGGTVIDARPDFDYTAECGICICANGHVHYPMEVAGDMCPDCDELVDIMGNWEVEGYGDYKQCSTCRYVFDPSEIQDEPISFYLDDGAYLAECGDSGDIFITKSPYYTKCQFCSPCAPGAGYIMNTVEEGVKAYCFGHDWFDDGKAPYPVYDVVTNEIVKGA